MSETELNSLIISNLTDLVGAIKQADQLHIQIWKHIVEEASVTAKALGWRVIEANHQFIAAPPEWIDDEAGGACFYLDKGPEDGDNAEIGESLLWLCRYLGIAGEQLCLWLDSGPGLNNQRKANLIARAEDIAARGAILGKNGHLFMSCSLSPDDVVEALGSGDFKPALKPVRRALEQAASLKPLLHDLLRMEATEPD